MAGDPSGDLERLEEQQAYEAAMARASSWLTSGSALAVSNMIATYPWLEPDVAVAAGVSGLSPDSPEMQQIADMMAYEQRGWLDRNVFSHLRSVSRFGTAAVETIYDNSILTRGLRMGVGMYQGLGFGEAWEQSRSSELYTMQRAAMAGQDYTLGEGWFATPQEHKDVPEYREAFLADMEAQKQELIAAGQPADQIDFNRAHAAGLRASPVDVGQAVVDDADRITVQSRLGGDPVPVSIGGLAAFQVLRPGSAPYSITSGMIDFPFRVGTDPLNVPFWQIENALHVRNAVMPAAGPAPGGLPGAAGSLPDLPPVDLDIAGTRYASIDDLARDLDDLSADYDNLDAASRQRLDRLTEAVGPEGDLSAAWNTHLAERGRPPVIPDLEADPARQSLIERTAYPEPPAVLTYERLRPAVGHVDPAFVAANPMQDAGGRALLVGIWNRLNETPEQYGARMAARHTPTPEPLTDIDLNLTLDTLRAGKLDAGARRVLTRFIDNADDTQWAWLAERRDELARLADEHAAWTAQARSADADYAAWRQHRNLEDRYGPQAQARVQARLDELENPPPPPTPTTPPPEANLPPVETVDEATLADVRPPESAADVITPRLDGILDRFDNAMAAVDETTGADTLRALVEDLELSRGTLQDADVVLYEAIDAIDQVDWAVEAPDEAQRVAEVRARLTAMRRRVGRQLESTRRSRLDELEAKAQRRTVDDPMWRAGEERRAEMRERQRRAIADIEPDEARQARRLARVDEPEGEDLGYIPEGDRATQPEVGATGLSEVERLELEELRLQARHARSVGAPAGEPPLPPTPRGDPFIASPAQLDEWGRSPIYSGTLDRMTRVLLLSDPTPATLRAAERFRTQIGARLRFLRAKVAAFVDDRPTATGERVDPITGDWVPEVTDEAGFTMERFTPIEDGAILSETSALSKSERIEFRKLKGLARRIGLDEAEELAPYADEVPGAEAPPAAMATEPPAEPSLIPEPGEAQEVVEVQAPVEAPVPDTREIQVLRRRLDQMRRRWESTPAPPEVTQPGPFPGAESQHAAELAARIDRFTARARRPQSREAIAAMYAQQAEQWPNRRPFNPDELAAEFNTTPDRMRAAGRWLADMGILRFSDDTGEAILTPMSKADGDEYFAYLTDLNNRQVDWSQLNTDPALVQESAEWRRGQLTAQLDYAVAARVAEQVDIPVGTLDGTWANDSQVLAGRVARAEQLRAALPTLLNDAVTDAVGRMAAALGWSPRITSQTVSRLERAVGFDVVDYVNGVSTKVAAWADDVALEHATVSEIRVIAETLARSAGEADDVESIAADIMAARGRGLANGPLIGGAPYEEAVLRGGLSGRRARRLRGDLASYASDGYVPGRRPWINPKTAEAQLASRDGQRLVRWVAQTTSPDQLTRILGNLPKPVLRRLLVASDPELVEKILLQQWGAVGGIRTRPRLGRAQRRQLRRPPEPQVGLSSDEIDDLVDLLGRQRRLTPDEQARLSRYTARRTGIEMRAADVEKPARAGSMDLPMRQVQMSDSSPWSRARRRWFAGGGSAGIELDVTDTMGTIEKVRNLLDTAGAPVEVRDSILRRLLFADPTLEAMLPIEESIWKALKASLARAGYNAEEIDEIYGSWHHVRLQQVNYSIDEAAGQTRVLHSGQVSAFGGPNAAEQVMITQDAMREAQYARRIIVVPAVADIRRATSKVRGLTDRLRTSRLWEQMGAEPGKLGLGRSLVQTKANQALSVWRAMALWRIAWPIKIVFDELGRMAASSYASDMTPVGLIGLIAGKGDASLVAGTVTDQAKLHGGLGTGLRLDPQTMSPLTGSFLDQTAQNWAVIRTDSRSGWRAQYAELLNMHNDVMTRQVASLGVDGAMDYFASTAGQAVLRDIVGRAAAGDATSKLFDPHTLRLHLEALEYDLARAAGGRGLIRDVGRNQAGHVTLGPWRYGDGRPLPANRAEVLAEIRRTHGSGAADRLEPLADTDLFIVAKGDYGVVHPSMAWHRDPAGQFIILDPGQQPIRDLVAKGHTGERRPDDSLWGLLWQIDNVDVEAAKYAFYPKNPADPTALGYGRFQYDPTRIVDTLDEAIEAAGDNGTVTILTRGEVEQLRRQARRQQDVYVDLDADPRSVSVSGVRQFRAGEQTDFTRQPGQLHFDMNMKPKDHERMAEILGDTYLRTDEYDEMGMRVGSRSTAPAFVRAPAGARNRLLTDTPTRARKVSDAVYHLLGALPTETFARHPMVKLAYWHEMAEYYLFVDDEARAAIRAAAEAGDFTTQFDAIVTRATRNHGFRQLPATRLARVDLDELNAASMARATEQVRDLLYDLTTTGNIADAARLIAPFGDAWWEVITRWGRIMNPASNPRALLNYRRVEQAMQEVKQSGWFSEDQFGNEVFTFPALDQIIPDQVAIGASWDPRSALFVDPGDPNSLLVPGSSPFIQVPASLIAPVLPPSLRDVVDRVVHGEFPPPATNIEGMVGAFLPTPYKRVLSLLYSEERAEELGSVMSRTLMALYASGDPRFDATTPQGRAAAMAEAQKVGTEIAWARLFSSVFVPGSTRFDAMQKVETDYVQGRASSDWLTVSDLAGEFFDALRITGSQEAAYAYFVDRIGSDPLWYQSATTTVRDRPKTKGAYDYLVENPVLRDFANFTLGAFLPVIEGDDFFARAQADAVSRQEQDIVLPSQIAERSLVRRGYMVARRMRAEFDEANRVAREFYGADSDAYREWKRQHDQVLSANHRTISTTYFGGSSSGNVVGERQPPTYEQMLGELREIGTEGTASWSRLHDLSPGYVDFLTKVDAMFDEAEAAVLQYNAVNGTSYQTSWWRSSTYGPDSVGGDAHQADAIKEWFTAGLAQLWTALPDQATKDSAMWAIDQVIAPLLNGFEDADYWMGELGPPPELNPARGGVAPSPPLATVGTP